MNKELDINNYTVELQQLCTVCKRSAKCKDKSKICFAKWTAFKLAKMKYKRSEKKVR